MSYETVRRWVNHFGPMIAAHLRKRRLKPHTTLIEDELIATPPASLSIVLGEFEAVTPETERDNCHQQRYSRSSGAIQEVELRRVLIRLTLEGSPLPIPA